MSEIPSVAPTAPVSPPTPPATPSNNKFGYLRYLRYFPYKTAILLLLIFYISEKIDKYLKDSIVAILTQFTVPENTWLYLNLNDLHITESPHSDRAIQLVPFVSSPGKRRMTVLELITTINDAAGDPRVKGLVLAFNESMIEHRAILTGDIAESHLGLAVLTDLHLALQKFAEVKRMQRAMVGAPDVSHQSTQELEIGKPNSKYDPSQEVVVAIGDNYSIIFSLCLNLF
jgi:hypothetical protein